MKKFFKMIWYILTGKSPRHLAYLIFVLTPITSAVFAVEAYKERGYFAIGGEWFLTASFLAIAFYLLWVDYDNRKQLHVGKRSLKSRYTTAGSLDSIELSKPKHNGFRLV